MLTKIPVVELVRLPLEIGQIGPIVSPLRCLTPCMSLTHEQVKGMMAAFIGYAIHRTRS